NTQYGTFITGVSGEQNSLANTNRHLGSYPAAQWIDDEFDLTPYKGKELILRFAYATDPAVAKRGWFIDDITVTADGADVYKSNFESSDENTRLFPSGWSRVSSADGLETDHAYYIEVRDRVSWDKDGKGQSDRGDPAWAPGVAILYTDENHGYGNTGNSDQPAQTVVDSQPQPGNMTPNLDDAAYTMAPNDNQFDGCTHIDNYATATSTVWKLPAGVNLTLTNLSGFTTDGNTSNLSATVIADVNPDCSIVQAPPVLRFGAGHTDPDTDGAVELAWDRPNGATGPDDVQEATLLSTLVSDDAESGLTQWVTSTEGTGAFNWETSTLKTSSGSNSFWGRTAEAATDASSILTYAQPIAIPAAGTATLEFSDWYMNEGDDKVVVEVSEDGATWSSIYEGNRSALAPDAALAFNDESLTPQSVNLTAYKGKTIRLRFRFVAGAENRAGSTPMGWYVDDIRISAANWYDVGTTSGTTFTRNGATTGTYYYRVRTRFAAGSAGVPSPWSNIVTTQVVYTPPPAKKADLVVSAIRAKNNKGNASGRISITAMVANTGDAASPATKTKFVLDNGTVLGIVDTPALASHGWIEVTVQWDSKGVDGQHAIAVNADDANQADESNEGNNANSINLTLKNGKL
ncbi:MAG TPA: CARDB domain-containing protein, partial [Thermoanaerobaculia bacterium]|nr:CARDB domain-containing protein [Thermoanaerobaculia bacterium]